MNDTVLSSKLKAGSQDAFRTLVENYQEKVLNTCYGFMRNKEEAEDLTQEVFIEVYNSIQQFRGDSKLSTWVYRIAVSKSLEEIRRRKRQKRAAYFKSLIGLEVAQEIVASTERDPHQLMEDEQRAELLHTMIEKLPENQRIAFTLHKYEGMSYKEIAEVMDVSLGATESLIFRAKTNLKKKLSVFYKNKMI